MSSANSVSSVAEASGLDAVRNPDLLGGVNTARGWSDGCEQHASC